ncbi:MAG: hypothetical protein R3302_03345 [Sulfurimonadaceae bacterium]|nr:hypothetical protein [Sulfurimonadaceae bacterium]
MKLAVFLLLPLIVLAVDEYDTKWCHDHSEHMKWEMLVQDNPDNDGIQALHALWLGLCIKVDAKQITTSKANEIFNSSRAAFLLNLPEEERNPQ